ncbi:MAG: ATP-binding cassette domain-containing protein [Propionibacteriaceae bacterium]|jgi:putative ABC transport system ATP-binding protein/lipoprotein-releasing system ATP-binding protein|nr:ATP-binding cassette domain-containing protein [Propionibacteriaceae bacterium]
MTAPPTGLTQPLVRAEGLGHRFPGQPFLFQGLGFTLRPGRTYAVTGPSGSGKSTLLGLLAGWIAPTAGRVWRQGVRQLNWVFQNPHGSPRRTALDHVAWPWLARGRPWAEARRAASELLDQFGLAGPADQAFRRLSGGEAQRLMLARALAAEPELLLVDEPTAQLDQHTAEQVNAVLIHLARRRTIVVIATHDSRTRDACSDQLDLTGPPPAQPGSLP